MTIQHLRRQRKYTLGSLFLTIFSLFTLLAVSSTQWTHVAHADGNSNSAEDNFIRANQTGWGNSLNPDQVPFNTWHNYADGTKSYVTITNNSAQFTDPGTGNYNIPIWAGDGIQSNGGDSLMEFVTNSGDTHGGLTLPLNFAPDASQGYECRANMNTGAIAITRRISSTTTSETSAAFTFSASNIYWMRCNYDGSGHVKLRIWKNGVLEPTTWNLSWTDTSPLASNYSGIGNFFTGTGSDIYNVYFFAFSSTPSTASVPSTEAGSNNRFDTEPSYGGKYLVDLNQWGSTADPYTLTTDSHNKFIITQSAINQTGGVPGSYSSIDTGCHSNGFCETGTNFPVLDSTLINNPGYVKVTSLTTVPGPNGGANSYDDAYDIFYTSGNQTGWSNATELMIWLDNTSDVQPAGSKIASNVSIGGNTYNVWRNGTSPGGTVTYQFATAIHSVTNLDLGPLTSDATTRGYIGSTSWYMEYVQVGFEVWKASRGLAVNTSRVCVNGSC